MAKQPAALSALEASMPLPSQLPYSDYVCRFDPAVALTLNVAPAATMAHLARIRTALATVDGCVREFGVRPAAADADVLYRTHGDPRD